MMIFSSYKYDNKFRFFFTYWVILFDTIYITFMLCLQYVQGLQCLSIVLLIIYFIVFSAILRPMKEKSEAFLFIFDYARVLLVAIVNLVLAVGEVSKSQPMNNDDIGWAIFIHYHSRKLVRKYSLCTLWNIYYQEYTHFTKNGRREGKKSNTESNKDLTIGKIRSSQRASLFIDSSKIASNFIVEEQKEETSEAQSKLHIEESKINSKRET